MILFLISREEEYDITPNYEKDIRFPVILSVIPRGDRDITDNIAEKCTPPAIWGIISSSPPAGYYGQYHRKFYTSFEVESSIIIPPPWILRTMSQGGLHPLGYGE